MVSSSMPKNLDGRSVLWWATGTPNLPQHCEKYLVLVYIPERLVHQKTKKSLIMQFPCSPHSPLHEKESNVTHLPMQWKSSVPTITQRGELYWYTFSLCTPYLTITGRQDGWEWSCTHSRYPPLPTVCTHPWKDSNCLINWRTIQWTVQAQSQHSH